MFTKTKKILKKSLNLFLSFALLVTMLLPAIPAQQAMAAQGDVPAHSKTQSNNGDGTYKLELTVRGDSVSEKPTANVNVLIVYDTSYSMIQYRANGGNTGPYRADAAEKVVYDFITALNTHQSGNSIQLALVTFASRARTEAGWTNNLLNVRSNFSSTGNNGSRHSGWYGNNNNNYNGTYTNWEGAMDQALTVVGQADSDPTFVIFVTDGAPTMRNGTGYNANQASAHYDAAKLVARNVQTSAQGKDPDRTGTMYGIYAYGNEANYLDDMIAYAYTGTERGSGSGTNPPAAGYYTATNTASLQAAFDEIFDTVVQTLGIDAVSINDGTTASVETTSGKISHLLSVDDTSFEYWLSIPLVNNTFTRTDRSTGETITYTVTSGANNTATITWGSNSVTVNGSVSSGVLKYQWEEANALYNFDPPEATFDGTSVNWNLEEVGTLLDNVTYSVTFDVYPSQETYDTIAELENAADKAAAYNALDENIRKYLHYNAENGSFTLDTNTAAVLSYKDTRIDNTIRTTEYDNPEPVPTIADEMRVVKTWSGEGEGKDEDQFQMALLRDGEPFELLTLNKDTDGSHKGSLYIATGLLRAKDDNTLQVLDTGHDYELLEPEALSHHWELNATVKHPMLVNGELTMLIEADNPNAISTGDNTWGVGADGKTYYKFGKKTYVADTSDDALSASNTQRSNLDIKKVIVGEAADPDTLFEFSVRINQPNIVYYDIDTDSIIEEAEDFWFSAWDTELNQIVKDLETDAIPEDGDTGYFHAINGSTITVKIKQGWNLRFRNVVTGTTYEITETNIPENFRIVADTGITLTPEDAADTPEEKKTTIDIPSGKVSGTISLGNTNYTATYTNEYVLADVVIVKTFERIGEAQIPAGFAITAKYTVDGQDQTTTLTINDDSDFPVEKAADTLKYTWKIPGLPLGTEVTIEEINAEIPGYSLDATIDPASGKVSLDDPNIYTVTLNNTYTQEFGDDIVETPAFTIKKVDQDNNPMPGITFTLKDGDTVIWTGSTQSDGTANVTFDKSLFAKNEPPTEEYVFSLTEAAPEGYTGAGPWEITITEDGKEVEVKLNEDLNVFQKIWKWIISLFNPSNDWDGSTNTLTVKNNINKYDVEVTKVFSGFDDPTLIPANFTITATYGNPTVTKELTTKNAATISADELTYTWTLEDVPYNTEISFTESNYEIPGYTRTEGIPTSGSLTVSTDESENVFSLSNPYTKQVGTDRVDDTVDLIKEDENGNVLDGAEFTLTGQIDGESVSYTLTAGEATIGTGAVGDVALSLSLLNAGEEVSISLTLAETKAPTGYKKINATYPVVVTGSAEEKLDTASNKYITTTTYTITIDGGESLTIPNEKITDKDRVDDRITVTKVDQDGNTLAGATFTLSGEGRDPVPFTAGTATIGTGASGDTVNLALPDLTAGNTFNLVLTLKETAAPAGYTLDNTEYTVTITGSAAEALNSDTGTFVTTTTYSIEISSTDPFVNTIITDEDRTDDKVTVNKIDGEDDSPLAGAVFTLSGTGFTSTTFETDSKGQFVIDTAALNLRDLADGETNNLTLTLKETTPPTGYKPITTEYTVAITGTGTAAWNEDHTAYVTTTAYTITVNGEKTLTVVNEKDTDNDRVDAEITITKMENVEVEGDDGEVTVEKRPLAGATFSLKGGDIDETITTGEDGKITIKTGSDGLGLPYLPKGTSKTIELTLKETKAPDGYELDDSEITIIIKGTAVESDTPINGKFVTTTTYTIEASSTADIINTKITRTESTPDDVFVLKVEKDTETPLAGAVFTLSGNGTTKTYTTGSDGKFTISTDDLNLPLLKADKSETWNYTLKETTPPTGYKPITTEYSVVVTASAEEKLTEHVFVTTTTYTIKINGGDSVIVVNEKDTGTKRTDETITIKKVDQDGNVLAGATFELSGEGFETKTITAGEAVIGTGTEGDLALNLPDLADGETNNLTLKLKETEAPAGYQKDDKEYTVTITGTGTEELTTVDGVSQFITTTAYTISISTSDPIVNTKITEKDRKDGEITIQKVDENGDALEGATFTLSGNGINKTFEAGKVTITTGASSDSGYVALDLADLLDGEGVELNLTLTETSAPAGYQKDSKSYTVSIKGTGVEALDEAKNAYVTTTTYTITVDGGDSLTVTNPKKTDTEREDAQITIIKVDQDGEALDGATFTLSGEGMEDISFQAGEAVISTGSEGDVALDLPDLADGETYEAELTIKEEAAPAGYDPDLTEYKVSIKGTGVENLVGEGEEAVFVTTTTYTITVNGGEEAKVPNPKRTDTDRTDAEITVRKVDENGELLEGATFQLTGEDIDVTFTAGEAIICTGSEGGDVNLDLPDLADGETVEINLTLKETAAPAGYVGDDTEYTVTITGEAVETLDEETNTFITTTTYTITVNGSESIDIVNIPMITPPTGDNHHMMLWYFMALVSLMGLSGCGVYLGKKRLMAKK